MITARLYYLMSFYPDIAESLVGDIPPEEFSGVSAQRKAALEADAMQNIIHTLGPSHALVGTCKLLFSNSCF